MSNTLLNSGYPDKKKFEPLIYDSNIIDFSSYNQVMLIDITVVNHDIFYLSANSNTFPIKFWPNSDFAELNTFLDTNFTQINRLVIVSDDGNIQSSKTLLNGKPYFIPEDFNSPVEYSDNLKQLIQLLKKFNISNLDFLACNTLKYSDWKQYYELIGKETGVVVGASEDQTGNLNSGGDWTLENTSQYVKDIYFTNLIDNYTDTLVGFPDGSTVYIRDYSGTIQYDTNPSFTSPNPISWPFTVTNGGSISLGITVLFTTNITLTDSTNYFITGSNNITWNGNNKTVTISNITNYIGLINNGTSGSSGKSNTTVQNFGLTTSGTSGLLANLGGWVCQGYFGKDSSNNLITNCYSTGDIDSDRCGGICGFGTGGFGGVVNIENCFSTGSISGPLSFQCAGICANLGGFEGGLVTITNCYSTGTIFGQHSGGICGGGMAYNGNATLINCYSLGNISGYGSGGIAGFLAGEIGGILNIINCYSRGQISGDDSGGIFGIYAQSLCTVTNSYSSGQITGSGAGGIFGAFSTAIQTNCYSANGSWSDTTALATLTGTPTLSNPIGTVWANTNTSTPNVPYIFSSFGTSPYSNPSSNLSAGQTSQTATLTSGVTYSLIAISNSPPAPPSTYPFITINPSTGAITIGYNPSTGTYTLYIYQLLSSGGYSVTTFLLEILPSSSSKISYCINTKTNKKAKLQLKQIDSITDNFKYKILKYPKKGKIISFDKYTGKIEYETPQKTGTYYLEYTCVSLGSVVSSKYKLYIYVRNDTN